jgi:signal transduction histidine kinase
MTSWLKGYVLYTVVGLIAVLLLGDIYLIYQNNRVITFNKNQQEQAEKVKVHTSEVIRSLHLLDLAVRSYAFVRNDHYKAAIDLAVKDNEAALSQLEIPLKAQNYSIEKFYALRDSIAAYIDITNFMIGLIEKGDQHSFVKLLEKDPGYKVWLQYQKFSKDINAFENEVSSQAKLRYERALNNIYILQIMLFFITVPTLAYTAYYTNRTILISEQLRKSEEEKATIFLHQNQLLEKTVHDRTSEILAQNEEITAQNEEIGMHNEKLMEAKLIIEDQNILIQKKNDELAEEVNRQTQDLKQANAELTEHNARLEQFAFIISHNLRAPMARLVGLSSILDFTTDVKEVSDIVKLMLKSTHDLDQVIKDLTVILGIQKTNVQSLVDIELDVLLPKVIRSLQEEIIETQTKISFDFTKAGHIKSLLPYMESVFYNLISNAIKYRHPDRQPSISIQSNLIGEYIQIDVADNGLGIDLETHKNNLFSLYKRFHFHVEGKGLGLYLVKTQLGALGAKIDVKSTEGVGTVFSLFIKR